MHKVSDLMLEVEEFVARQCGKFSLQDMYNELGITGKIDKKHASIYMIALTERNIIERDPAKSGIYRTVLRDIDEIDYKNAPETIFPMLWPLHIEKLALMHPKTIAVVAGEPESGKTAILLNVLYLNNERYEDQSILFSSEMGAVELRSRLQLFQRDINWWKFKAYERSGDFADVIEPNALNVIDYLEISDNFFRIAGQLKAIRDKLEDGIAIIALQKSEESKYGRGGTFGAEKARIYLSLDSISSHSTRLHIIKAKNRASAINPIGLTRKFSISGGTILTPLTDDWERDGEDPDGRQG